MIFINNCLKILKIVTAAMPLYGFTFFCWTESIMQCKNITEEFWKSLFAWSYWVNYWRHVKDLAAKFQWFHSKNGIIKANCLEFDFKLHLMHYKSMSDNKKLCIVNLKILLKIILEVYGKAKYSHCVCGTSFSVHHAIVCRHGGLTFIRYNELCDLTLLTADWLKEVCHNFLLELPIVIT